VDYHRIKLQLTRLYFGGLCSLRLCLLGLKAKTEQKLKEIDAKNRKLTPWQEYREKRAKKKLEKKEAKSVC